MFRSFKSVQTTCRATLLCVLKVSNQFEPLVDRQYKVVLTMIQCLIKASNLFEPLVDEHFEVVSHDFDVFQSFKSVRTTSVR